MDRINVSSATPEHLFTEGNPGLGIPATTVSANWLNGDQEEMMEIIESSFQVGSDADRAQVLKGLFRMVRRENLAFNADFLFAMGGGSTVSGKDMTGGVSGVATRIMKPAGWKMGDNTTLISPVASPTYVNYVEPNKGWHHDCYITGDGQGIELVCEEWAGYYSSLWSESGPQDGVGTQVQAKPFTIALTVGNHTTSEVTLDAEILGFGTGRKTDVGVSGKWQLDQKAEGTAVGLAAGGESRIFLTGLWEPPAGQSSSPLTGPVIKVTLHGASGSHALFSVKRLAIYEGCFTADYVPDWTPSNPHTDRSGWSAMFSQSAGSVRTGKTRVPLSHDDRSTSRASWGYMQIAIPGANRHLYSSPGTSIVTAVSVLETTVQGSREFWTLNLTSGQESHVAVPDLTVSFVSLADCVLTLRLDFADFGSPPDDIALFADIDLVINWIV